MTKESDHSANLSKAREMLLVERRQLAAELTKSYQRGDGEKRERFMVVQPMMEGFEGGAREEAGVGRGGARVLPEPHYATETQRKIPGKKTLPPPPLPASGAAKSQKRIGGKVV